MRDALEYYDLEGAPLVRVYKNLLPDVGFLYEILKDGEVSPDKYISYKGWWRWHELGKQLQPDMNELNKRLTDDGRYPEEEVEQARTERAVQDMIMKAFDDAIDDYCSYHGIDDKTGWFPDGPSYYKYEHELPAPSRPFPTFSMNYHTDYTEPLKGNPGKKEILTCTMYPNDDYEGGEIIYNIEKDLRPPYFDRKERFSDDEPQIASGIVYKPSAGDVVVFPAGHPDYSPGGYYFHSVSKVTSGYKYFITIFASHMYEGDETFREGLEEYGPELWEWLELRRLRDKSYKTKKVM